MIVVVATPLLLLIVDIVRPRKAAAVPVAPAMGGEVRSAGHEIRPGDGMVYRPASSRR